ncbi:ribosome assembly RNA-binding protein YhbY [Allohahella marinimesophila]|uniref:CRM domain-containing protein n=1 Tax=Allohahella marinimesophila TaxID=1054972 RepID=A0ABP7Q1E5_9GAMM
MTDQYSKRSPKRVDTPSTRPAQSSKLKTIDKKSLRAIAHELKPVIIVGEKGLTDTVIGEVERALADHELIKVKLASNDRDERKEIVEAIIAATKATQIQLIGKVLVLLKRSREPKPGLSNLIRFQASAGKR